MVIDCLNCPPPPPWSINEAAMGHDLFQTMDKLLNTHQFKQLNGLVNSGNSLRH